MTPNTNVFSIEPGGFPTNYTFQWNLNIQRELLGDWMLEVGYLGNSAHKLTGRVLANQAMPDADPLHPTSIASRRPNPAVGDVSYVPPSINRTTMHSTSS